VVPSKTWLAIPALAIVCAAIVAIARQPAEVAIAAGALAAAIAAAVRAFAGPSVAVAVAGGAAALLGVLAVLDLALPDVARAALACAAALFAIGELARPLPPDASPWPALGAAGLASLLDPAFCVLAPVAGVRLVTGPWSVPRWAYAIPAAGVIVVVIGVLVVTLRHGAFADLWSTWVGRPAHAREPLVQLVATGEVIGPIGVVVAVAGLGLCGVRGRLAATATLGATASALLVDLAAGSTGAATVACAALGTGMGISRFAALVRWPTGQAFVGGTVGFMLVVAPAWTLAMR
jgi:hypothetical protein